MRRGTASEDGDQPDVSDIVEAVRGLAEGQLRGFAPDGTLESTPEGYEHGHRFALEAVANSSILDLLLEAVVRAESLPTPGRYGWEYAFRFRDVRCRLAWRKSGIHLSLWHPTDDDATASALANEIEKRLIKASAIVYRRAIANRVAGEVAANRVTVVNHFARYRGMVDYFIAMLDEKRGRGPGPVDPVVDEEHTAGIEGMVVNATRGLLADVHHRRELGYLATALLASYGAYIQHILVTLSAFSPRALSPGFSVKDLLAAPWAEQFDVAFPEPRGTPLTEAKQDLMELARRYRNPLLHGGAGRASDGLFVEWAPGRDILVSDDGAPGALFMLWQPSLSEAEINDVLARIDRIDDAFRTQHPYFAWAESGLAADFRPASIRRALDAHTRGESDRYTAAHDEAYDRDINWD